MKLRYYYDCYWLRQSLLPSIFQQCSIVHAGDIYGPSTFWQRMTRLLVVIPAQLLQTYKYQLGFVTRFVYLNIVACAPASLVRYEKKKVKKEKQSNNAKNQARAANTSHIIAPFY